MENMLEHQITVLMNVIDNKDIFKKELEKSTKWLSESELEKLKKYLYSAVSYDYHEIIEEIVEKNLAS